MSSFGVRCLNISKNLYREEKIGTEEGGHRSLRPRHPMVSVKLGYMGMVLACPSWAVEANILQACRVPSLFGELGPSATTLDCYIACCLLRPNVGPKCLQNGPAAVVFEVLIRLHGRYIAL